MTAPATAEAPARPGRPRGHLIVHDVSAAPAKQQPAGTRSAPLLAVCGLCGGAGTSTLSYLLARYAAVTGPGPVLVADTGGPSGGLAALAGVDARRTLPEAGEQLARGVAFSAPLYALDPATGRAGQALRVLATGPRCHPSGGPAELDALLRAVRRDDAHAFVVVDCATLQRAPERAVLRAASHVAWMLPATRHGAARGAQVLELWPARSGTRELVIARRDATQAPPALRTLTALAERRHAPLVLLPHLDDVESRPDRALTQAAVSLQAICGVLNR